MLGFKNFLRKKETENDDGINRKFGTQESKNKELSAKLIDHRNKSIDSSKLPSIRKHINWMSDVAKKPVPGTRTEFNNNSRNMNDTLSKNYLNGKEEHEGMDKKTKTVHDTIKSNSKPLGVNFTTYHGLSFDPRPHLSKNKDIHVPYHMSTSHSAGKAKIFAGDAAGRDKRAGGEGIAHIAKIKVSKNTKGFHVSDMSEFPEEHETIFPAGTKLKYSHTTKHTLVRGRFGSNHKVLVHHFTA